MKTTFSKEELKQWNRPNKFFFVCAAGMAPVDSPADASEKWESFRDESNGGCSEIGNGGIVVNQRGEWVCRVSYNGRLWFSKDEQTEYDKFLLKKLPKLQGRQLCAS